MPSPFPGMDPFIESDQMWSDFHGDFIVEMRELLVKRVRPDYDVEVQKYVYLVDEAGDRTGDRLQPDVSIDHTGIGWREYAGSANVAAPLIENQIEMVERVEQSFIAIYSHGGRLVVTVVELLSPTNKDSTKGRDQYLQKRSNIQWAGSNLVEIDLLRGGDRLPTLRPLQPGDFYVYFARAYQLQTTRVFGWSLRDPLPTIGIPQLEHDREVPLDLQAAFEKVYDRAGYDYSLNYSSPIEPPLSSADAERAREIIARIPPLNRPTHA